MVILVKIIISDYDDTFYTNSKDIKKNVKAVNKFMNNNLFAIATGRSYHDFLDVKELYNINYNYLIINHGSTILHNNTILYNSSIDNRIKNNILKELNLDKTVNYLACSTLNSRVSLTSDNLTKINVRYNTEEIARKIMDLINIKYGRYVNCFMVCENKVIEIVSKASNKENAIKFIADKENILLGNIYTIGDGYSDIEMVKQFNGFAMENAIKELKDKARAKYKSVYQLIYDVENGKYE